MSAVMKNVYPWIKCQPSFVRAISLSRRLCEKEKKDDFDPSKAFKDLKPNDLANIDQFKEKIAFQDPFVRTGKIIKNDMKYLGYRIKRFIGFEEELSHDVKAQFFPTHTDVLIIGGGAMGASIAYWLKQRAPHGMHVLVAEKDPSYAESSTCLSVGGLRQQFSIPENVQMSLFGAEFLSNVGKHLGIENKLVPDVNFQPYGYLVLASDKGAQTLKENSEMQCKLGARNVLLSPNKLKERFPWINTEGIELGCLGLEHEGWFDPWSLLSAFRAKSINLGAEYIEAEVVGFESILDATTIAATPDGKYKKVERAIVKLPNGDIQTIKFGFCIIAAGAQSGNIAAMARVGQEEGILSIPLPIEPRKRYVYCYRCPEGPGLDTPLVIDPSGAYFRREGLGGCYIAGKSPALEEEPSIDNLDVDYNFYNEKVWPIIANRVPSFENSKLQSGWAGFYEYNTMDANGIIGIHPILHNIIFASGFSGHGIQHAPAVGRGVMELLLDGEFKTIDLSRFGFERLCLAEPLVEKNIF